LEFDSPNFLATGNCECAAIECQARTPRGDFRGGAVASLALIPVKVDAEADRQAWSADLSLAERHGLTVYDAAYLETASRQKIPLATLDLELQAAAKDENVELLAV
jgi:hypothetical protein